MASPKHSGETEASPVEKNQSADVGAWLRLNAAKRAEADPESVETVIREQMRDCFQLLSLEDRASINTQELFDNFLSFYRRSEAKRSEAKGRRRRRRSTHEVEDPLEIFTEWISTLSKESSEPNADEKTNHAAKLFIGAFRRKRVLDMVMVKARSSGFTNVGTPPPSNGIPPSGMPFNLEEARKPQMPSAVNSLSHRWGQVVATVIGSGKDQGQRHEFLGRLKRLSLEEAAMEELAGGQVAGAGGSHQHGEMRRSTGSFPEDYHTMSKSARRRVRRGVANQRRREKIEITKEHVGQMKQMGMQSLAAISRKQKAGQATEGAAALTPASSDKEGPFPDEGAWPVARDDDDDATTSAAAAGPRKAVPSLDTAAICGVARNANHDVISLGDVTAPDRGQQHDELAGPPTAREARASPWVQQARGARAKLSSGEHRANPDGGSHPWQNASTRPGPGDQPGASDQARRGMDEHPKGAVEGNGGVGQTRDGSGGAAGPGQASYASPREQWAGGDAETRGHYGGGLHPRDFAGPGRECTRDGGGGGGALSPRGNYVLSPRDARNGTNPPAAASGHLSQRAQHTGAPRGANVAPTPIPEANGNIPAATGVFLPALGGKLPDVNREPEWMASLKKTLLAREARPRVHRSSKMLATPRPPGVSPAKHVGSLLVLDDSQWSTSGSRSLATEHALWSQISQRNVDAERAERGSVTDRGPRGSGLVARNDIRQLDRR